MRTSPDSRERQFLPCILRVTILSSDGGETVHTLYTLMLADVPYTLLKGAVYIHPTLAEGLFFLMDAVKPVP